MGKYTAIDDPSAHFQVETYTGAGQNTSVTFSGNSDLKPDWLWLKNRTADYAHAAFDSNRNLGSAVNAPFLEPNDTTVENSNQNWWNSTNNGINTDGFQFGSVSEHNLNNLGSEYVAWAWKCNGGTTSSLSNTGPDSVVQLNSDAKFVIGTYTGNGSNSNVKHGLGETPDLLIVKRRNVSTGSWAVWHKDLTSAYWLRLDADVGQATGVWDGLDPNSEKFFISGGSSNVNISGSDYVFYAFKSVQGYSKFGKYYGNGNADGPFVHTGFKPAFVLYKKLSAEDWVILDNKRDPFNPAETRLKPNKNKADNTALSDLMDFTSNGFKLRSSSATINSNNTDYIYWAFAENPFVTSTGIPTTAR